ncbi:unnamed protein product [Arabis nemorensis]|uniref:Uncharacterized protein n=1 Tax=Arabis nemorensis TaxID=586526 RepID=A0A565B2Z7_9BRAS|nr:unnamed protein product [Arabis nemorensis]
MLAKTPAVDIRESNISFDSQPESVPEAVHESISVSDLELVPEAVPESVSVSDSVMPSKVFSETVADSDESFGKGYCHKRPSVRFQDYVTYNI